MEVFINSYYNFVFWFLDYAWIWLPFVLGIVFFESWMYYSRRLYWQNLDWIMLEIKPPKEIQKTPKTMEQIFAGLWSIHGTVGTKYKKYVLGMIQDYLSFEIVGSNGDIHFYLRILRKYRDLVEANFYSQYPQAEIKEVQDYADAVPSDIPNKNWDFWATRIKLEKDSAYPIKTYMQFVDAAKTEQVFLDPLAGFMELMGKLKFGEQIWIQFVFRPVPDSWGKEQVKEQIDKLAGKPTDKKEGIIAGGLRTWVESIGDVLKEMSTSQPTVSSNSRPDPVAPASKMQFLTPGEKEIVAAIELKISKKIFETKIQWGYFARREIFSQANITAINGLFAQYAMINMNSFKNDSKTATKADYALAAYRKAFKQRKMIKLLKRRSFWEKSFVLNVEELATVFHLPTEEVRSPMTPFIDAKKGGAPVGLPIE